MKPLFSVFDNKSKEFGPLFSFNTDEAAIRAYKEEISKAKYIIDLDLYKIGSFDEKTGNLYLNPSKSPVLLMTGNELFNSIMNDADENAQKLRLQELGSLFEKLPEDERKNLISKVKEMKKSEKAS